MTPHMIDQGRLERERLGVVLATAFINVVAVVLLTLAPWSDWTTGLGLNLIYNVILLAFITYRRDRLLERFLLFGLGVGFVEPHRRYFNLSLLCARL